MAAQILKKIKIPLWLLWMAIIFFILLFTLVSTYLSWENKYINKIYPGLYLGEIILSGKTLNEAKKTIDDKINLLNQDGINFYYGDNSTTIFPIVSSLEGDIARQIINFDTDKTLATAYGFGRSGNFFADLKNKIKTLFSNKAITLTAAINDNEIEKILKEKFSNSEIPTEDAQLIHKKINDPAGSETIEFEIIREKAGRIIDYQKGISQLKANLIGLNFGPIKLTSNISYPQIYQKDCLNINNKAQNILTLSPITLKYKDNEWIIEKAQLASWLGLKNNPEFKKIGAENKEKIIIGLTNEATRKFLEDEVALKINKKPIEAKFEIKDGKVAEFQASQDGAELDAARTLLKIESELTKSTISSSTPIELIVQEIKSAVLVENINNMGIKEIIGTGESNFKGSPKNRRHNIKVGADTLNGLLIKPGEEFSTMKALGNIDGSTGYLPELVIKDNKTTPEFGGGLCQIGTTMFRAALASGLPITARRNHSYRVPYYEPAGTDATIYDPWPDLKFINDTNNYILIQTRIDGDNLYFDFWNAKDGRITEQTKPIIYNIVSPGPTKLIETLDLKPGEKKCTERAHKGADTYFDYKITYSNGKIKENRFNSHYVPWQEVCLIGVEKLSAEEDKSRTF
jgi:vancomycin resistance protein YoaR